MNRVVIVTKPTRFEELVREYMTEGTARFVLESQGQSIEPYRVDHETYHAALQTIRSQLPNDLPVTLVSREELPKFLFRDSDLIIVCGPDGLFVNLAQYVKTQAVLAVNPDPRKISGKLMIFRPDQVGMLVKRVQDGTSQVEELPFIRASFDDQVVWGINDVFIGRRDQVSAWYTIEYGDNKELQCSSGVIVSSGIGSSGWLRSVIVMAESLTLSETDSVLGPMPGPTDEELIFVVREPFPSPSTGTEITAGRLNNKTPLRLTCKMPSGGVIFSDGIVEKGLNWPAGSAVTISVGERKIRRLIG